MKLFFISLFCIVPLINGRSTGGRATNTCIADYLASIGLIGSEWGSEDSPSQLCSAIVEVTKVTLLKGVKQEIASDDDMRPETACIMDNLKSSNFSNLLLVIYVYESAEGIDTTKRDEALKLINTELAKTMFDSYAGCQANRKFGAIFDSLLDDDSSSSSEEMDAAEDYCVRKRIVDVHLAGSPDVTIKINPKKIDTADISDCDVLYQKALKTSENEFIKSLLEGESDEEGQDDHKTSLADVNTTACLHSVVRENSFTDQLIQFDFIKEMTLSKARKTEMRNKFIQIMTSVAKASSKCFL